MSMEYFITSARSKATIASQSGYDLLPLELSELNKAAGFREDVCDQYLHLRSSDRHYRINNIPGPVHIAANKAEGVDDYYEKLVKENNIFAQKLSGHKYTVMDNQMIIVYPSGEKVALKKPHNAVGTLTLIESLKFASEQNARIEYLSAFVSGIFGSADNKTYKTVRVDIGELKKNIDTQLLSIFMDQNSHVTGGVDVTQMVSYFVNHHGAKIRVRKYREIARHYEDEGQVVVIDKLMKTEDREVEISADYISDKNALAHLARGFIEIFGKL